MAGIAQGHSESIQEAAFRKKEFVTMPIYVYEVILEDGESGQQFEVSQKMTDDALTEHPTTGQPVRRVIQPPLLGGKYSDAGMKKTVNDEKKLDKMGFTKYVKQSDGTYEKKIGKGPDGLKP